MKDLRPRSKTYLDAISCPPFFICVKLSRASSQQGLLFEQPTRCRVLGAKFHTKQRLLTSFLSHVSHVYLHYPYCRQIATCGIKPAFRDQIPHTKKVLRQVLEWQNSENKRCGYREHLVCFTVFIQGECDIVVFDSCLWAVYTWHLSCTSFYAR